MRSTAAATLLLLSVVQTIVAQSTAPTTGPSAVTLQTAPPAASQPARDMAHDPRMAKWRQVFFWSVVLLLVLIVSAGAIIRFSMRFRTLILRDESPPTESADVWAMHRFPEKFEFEDGGEPENDGPNEED
ncbi:MAG: hypothetical protein AABZ08_13465 [Planctomycetota bacterium]